MPRIVEYQQQIANPSGEIKAYADPSAAARVGAALGTTGDALQSVGSMVHKMNERKDMSLLQAETATARADLTEEMNRAVHSGEASDPEFIQKFSDKASARMAGIQDRMQTRTGQNSATVYSADLTGQFRTQAYQASAIAAGEKAKENFSVALDANRRVVSSDPLQFGDVMKEQTALLNDPNGPYAALSAKDRLAIQNETQRKLALSAMQGTIRNIGPELALAQLNNNEGAAAYLDADTKDALISMADTHIRARLVEDERLQRQKERAEAEARELRQQEFVDLMVAGKLTTKMIIDTDPPLTADQQQHWLNAIKADSEQRVRDDPAAMLAAFRDIHRPDGDPKKITSVDQLVPRVGKGIGFSGFDRLRKELDLGPFGRDMQAAMETANTKITRSLIGAIMPDLAAEAAYNFRLDFNAAVTKAREEGKDPRVLITPPTPGHPNPDYWLNEGRISTYIESAQGYVKKQADAVREGADEAREKMAKGELPKIRTVEELNALPPGAWFVNGTTGQLSRKP